MVNGFPSRSIFRNIILISFLLVLLLSSCSNSTNTKISNGQTNKQTDTSPDFSVVIVGENISEVSKNHEGWTQYHWRVGFKAKNSGTPNLSFVVQNSIVVTDTGDQYPVTLQTFARTDYVTQFNNVTKFEVYKNQVFAPPSYTFADLTDATDTYINIAPTELYISAEIPTAMKPQTIQIPNYGNVDVRADKVDFQSVVVNENKNSFEKLSPLPIDKPMYLSDKVTLSFANPRISKDREGRTLFVVDATAQNLNKAGDQVAYYDMHIFTLDGSLYYNEFSICDQSEEKENKLGYDGKLELGPGLKKDGNLCMRMRFHKPEDLISQGGLIMEIRSDKEMGFYKIPLQ